LKVIKAVVYLPGHFSRSARAFLVGALVLTTWVVSASPTHAAAPYRNSTVSYRNSVSVIGLQKDAELSHNPYYAMTLGLSPRWWFSESVYVQGRFSLTRELTDSDSTTLQGETVPSDLRLRLGAANLVRVPGIGLDVSATFDVVAPTSPVSRARSLMTAVAGGLTLKRKFSWLEGVSFAYSFQFQKGFHEFTTSQYEQPVIAGCSNALECSELTHTGVRNSSYRMVHSLSLNVGILPWMSAFVSGGIIGDTLYDLSTDQSVSNEAQNPQNTRYLGHADMGLTFTPMRSFAVTLGVSTVHPQLAPDSSFYSPVFNRYTMTYLDISLDIAGLVSQITDRSSDKKD